MKILTETGLTELIRKIKTTKQDTLPTVSNDKFLHTNSNTGALEWVNTATASTLAVDSTPTASSTNLVTSGGVYTALSGKQDVSATFSYDDTTYPSTGIGTFPIPSLANNTIYSSEYSAGTTSLTISALATDFKYATITFTCPSSAGTTIDWNNLNPYCIGADCNASHLLVPVAGTRYNMAIEQEYDRLAVYVMDAT